MWAQCEQAWSRGEASHRDPRSQLHALRLKVHFVVKKGPSRSHGLQSSTHIVLNPRNLGLQSQRWKFFGKTGIKIQCQSNCNMELSNNWSKIRQLRLGYQTVLFSHAPSFQSDTLFLKTAAHICFCLSTFLKDGIKVIFLFASKHKKNQTNK